MQEYEFIYGRSVKDDLKALGITNEEAEEANQKLVASMQKTTWHFGHPYLNVATVAGTYRMLLKQLAKEKGLELDPPRPKEKPWYAWW